MNFREIIKDLRLERGITQGEVAKGCELTPTCICQLETGARKPTGSTVAALAKFFDVTADYLLGLTSDDDAKLYSAPTASTMGDVHSSKELQLLEIYRNLSPDMQATLWSLLETWNPSTHKNKV